VYHPGATCISDTSVASCHADHSFDTTSFHMIERAGTSPLGLVGSKVHPITPLNTFEHLHDLDTLQNSSEAASCHGDSQATHKLAEARVANEAVQS